MERKFAFSWTHVLAPSHRVEHSVQRHENKINLIRMLKLLKMFFSITRIVCAFFCKTHRLYWDQTGKQKQPTHSHTKTMGVSNIGVKVSQWFLCARTPSVTSKVKAQHFLQRHKPWHHIFPLEDKSGFKVAESENADTWMCLHDGILPLNPSPKSSNYGGEAVSDNVPCWSIKNPDNWHHVINFCL